MIWISIGFMQNMCLHKIKQRDADDEGWMASAQIKKKCESCEPVSIQWGVFLSYILQFIVKFCLKSNPDESNTALSTYESKNVRYEPLGGFLKSFLM